MLLEFAALKDDIQQYVDPTTPKSNLLKLTKLELLTLGFVQTLRLNCLHAAALTTTTVSAAPTIQSQTPTVTNNLHTLLRSNLMELEKNKLEELLEKYRYNYKKYLAQDQVFKLL